MNLDLFYFLHKQLNQSGVPLRYRSGTSLVPLWYHSSTAHLQVQAVVLHHPLSERRDVDPSVALSGQEELILGELREQLEELFESQVVVHGHLQTEHSGPHRKEHQGHLRATNK